MQTVHVRVGSTHGLAQRIACEPCWRSLTFGSCIDVSTAFMYAARQLKMKSNSVVLPGNITTESRRGRPAMQRVI